MSKFLPVITALFLPLFVLGCNNEMKYILLDKAEQLQGYVIFEKEGTKNLCYFDLGQNKVYEIPFTNLRMVNAFLASYSFYRDNETNVMVSYIGKNNRICLQFKELRFSDKLEQHLIFEKEIEGVSLNETDYKFSYLQKTRELYYYSYYKQDDPYAKLINIDSFKMKKLLDEDYFTPSPVDFFENKYLALGFSGIFFYDEDKIEDIYNYDNPFIECDFARYSRVLERVKYSDDDTGSGTMKIFDVAAMQIIDTGIYPMGYDRIDDDKDKFHFFGDRCILYARYKEKASKLARFLHEEKVRFPEFLNPVEYVIYDYVNKKEIGYVQNCKLNAVYDFFPD